MTLCRCAACGSRRVVCDEQSGGYSYSKGLFGSLLFGTGGAAAGVNGKKQAVYKCPDCGVSLTYPMPSILMAKIERGLIDPTFPSLDWAALKAQFKNLEDGVLDHRIAQDENIKAEAVRRIAPISEDEFIAIATEIASYIGKCGYYGRDKRIYDKTHLPSVEEYLSVCKQAKEFINHMPQFMKFFDMKMSKNSPEYQNLFDPNDIRQLMLFVIVLDYYERTNQPVPLNKETAQEYFRRNMHLKELALKSNVISDGRDTTFIFGGSYNPDDIYFNDVYAILIHEESDNYDYIEWLYQCRDSELELYVYPQLIVKNNRIELNHFNC